MSCELLQTSRGIAIGPFRLAMRIGLQATTLLPKPATQARTFSDFCVDLSSPTGACPSKSAGSHRVALVCALKSRELLSTLWVRRADSACESKWVYSEKQPHKYRSTIVHMHPWRRLQMCGHPRERCDEQDGGDVDEKGEERGERVNLSCGAQRRLCPETEI